MNLYINPELSTAEPGLLSEQEMNSPCEVLPQKLLHRVLSLT